MKLELMPDSRQYTLVKAAEECIDLMNVGVAPNAALKKVASDFGMNDKEVTLVSHAVNNAKQLSHLQSSKGEDKEKPFELTNAKDVIGANDTSDLETLTPNAAMAKDQNGAEILSEKVASVDAYTVKGSFRSVAPETSDLDIVKAAFALDGVGSTPVTDLSNPYNFLNPLKLASEAARTESVRYRDLANDGIEKIASAFIRVSGESFAAFEVAAKTAGVSDDIVDIIYAYGPEALDIERSENVKVASERLYVSKGMMELVKAAKEVDVQWNKSAAALAEQLTLDEQIKEAEAKLAFGLPKGWADLSALNELGSSARSGGESTKSLLGLGEDPGTLLTGAAGTMDPENVPSKDPDIHVKVRQELENSKARGRVENLLQDPYVGKHPLPDIIEAYNHAMSVQPHFGDAEISAFVKQQLASRGAMPLDLLLRASKPRTSREES